MPILKNRPGSGRSPLTSNPIGGDYGIQNSKIRRRPGGQQVSSGGDTKRFVPARSQLTGKLSYDIHPNVARKMENDAFTRLQAEANKANVPVHTYITQYLRDPNLLTQLENMKYALGSNWGTLLSGLESYAGLEEEEEPKGYYPL